MTQLSLPVGKPAATLPAVSGYKPENLFARLKGLAGSEAWQNGATPTFLTATIPTVFAIAETVEHPCPVCWTWQYVDGLSVKTPTMIKPEPLSDPEQGWITYPCHEFECAHCYNVVAKDTGCRSCEDCCSCDKCSYCSTCAESTCDYCSSCEDCCGCYYCSAGGHHFSPDNYCSSCDNCEAHCSCEDRYTCSCCSSSSYEKPGWKQRGWTVERNMSVKDVLKTLGIKEFDPVQAMADFYLCDYVMAVIPSQVTRNNAGWRDAALLRSDAKTIQDSIVRAADDLFRVYVLAACAGEARHHQNVSGDERSEFWNKHLAFADKYGPIPMLEDYVSLFGDGSWSSGYGGSAWRSCAKTALARETGKLDAKTFVDRVFALQHNSGSLLNKTRWAMFNSRGWTPDNMQAVGEAHHSTDFCTLLSMASPDVAGLVTSLVTSCCWTLKIKGLEAHYSELSSLLFGANQ